MNILLFSMPDSFEHMPPIAIRMPNGALTSLAGNVDPHHRVAAADLVLVVQDGVRETVERLVGLGREARIIAADDDVCAGAARADEVDDAVHLYTAHA
jgi:hypothetical protein